MPGLAIKAFWLRGWPVWNDTATGTVILSGSRVESKVGSDSPTGTFIFTGSSTETKIGADGQTGTLTFTGSRVEAITFSQTAVGTLIFTGSATSSPVVAVWAPSGQRFNSLPPFGWGGP